MPIIWHREVIKNTIKSTLKVHSNKKLVRKTKTSFDQSFFIFQKNNNNKVKNQAMAAVFIYILLYYIDFIFIYFI